jgi:hypothetical protein
VTLSRDAIYRSRQVVGLLIVASVVLAFAIVRASWHDLFPTGWWRVW